ncbi:MFS transporter [Vagococcus fluvialis]|uniref:MFS transporter n=1 Tax=Vagococcus fluvialis TaxID=2738 RepID=UPI003B20E07A
MSTQNHQHGIYFGFMTAFLTGLALTIISPVIPFIVEQYTSNTKEQATIMTLLMSIYALSTFVSAPILGSLSDYFGRKPVLILSLLGSALGYVIFGFGGAIWILFLGRIIEGISGGEIATIFAYFSDITTKEERIKYFGWLSATVGVGTAFGPIIGGLLAHFGNSAPFYFGAGITILNACYGYFFMPESLEKKEQTTSFSLKHFNFLDQLKDVLSLVSVKWLLMAGFFIWLGNGSFQAIFSQFTIDLFQWQPALIGLSFSMIGFVDIFVQLILMPKLINKLSDKQVVLSGVFGEFTGYIVIGLSAVLKNPILFLIGLLIFSFGDAIFSPSFNGFLSKSVESKEQGKLQGSSQSIQALARVIGPLIGGQIYSQIGLSSPAFMSVILILIAITLFIKKIK